MAKRMLKATAVGSISALALAAAGQASAVDFDVNGTNVDIYGYAIGKVSYDFDAQLGDATALNPNNAADVEQGGYTDLDATQSRLGFQTTTEVGGQDLVTKLETDFRGGAFRIRHAYGSYNGWLVGQTWSNFNSFAGFTPTVDFNSSAGAAGVQGRVAQVRYTTGNFSVAIEDPLVQVANINATETAAVTTATQNSLPAFTARYEGAQGPLSYSIAGVAKQIQLDPDQAANPATAPDDSAVGFGTFVAGGYDFGAFSLQGNVGYFDGASSYMYLSGQNFYGTDGYVDANGDIETVTGFGGTIGVSVDAGPGTFNVVYGRTMQDDT